MVEFGLHVPRCNLLARMGMGKSSPVLSVIDTRMLAGEVNKTLLLAPLRVARSTWPEEAAKWSQFSHLRVEFLERWTPQEETYLRALTVAWKAEAKEDKATARDAHRVAAQLQPAARDSRLAIIDRLDIQTVNYEVAPQFVAILQGSRPFQMGVADECFPAGTRVLTPQGLKRIECFEPGNQVSTVFGPKRITRVYRKESKAFVRLHLSDGREVVVTPTHRFWTEGGWVRAEHLAGHTIVRASDVQALRGSIRDQGFDVEVSESGAVLQSLLRDSCVGGRDPEGMVSESGSQVPCSLAGGQRIVEHWRTDFRVGETEVVREGQAAGRPFQEFPRRQWHRDEPLREDPLPRSCPGLGLEPRGQHQAAGAIRLDRYPVELQDGLRVAGSDDLPGSRWPESPNSVGPRTRSEEGRSAQGVRVDRVENFERGSPVPVWDIEVEDAHHYFAEDCLVHNCTKLKSFRLLQGGRRAQAISQVAHDMLFWMNLSGGIVPNGLANLWGPMHFIDQGARLGRTYDAFESRWFGYQRASDAVNAHKTRITRIAFPHAQAEILERIKDVSLALNPKDWFGIKDPIVERVYVDLPPEARKKYREMERDMFTHIAGHDIEAFASSGKVIKCLQLANGAVYTGAEDQIERDISHWVPAHDEKLDALESIINENDGEVILVAYHFKPDLARLKKRFPQGRHIDTKKDEDAFKRGEIPLAFVHPQSIGHGVDGFQNVCHIIVFFAITFDLDPHDQIIERVGPMRQMQAGFDREVMVYLILARGTVDEIVDERLVKKRAVQDATMDSLAYKPEPALW